MFLKLIYYTGIIACLALIGNCFMPWVHYNNINVTFSGMNVTKFAAGNYYGKAGIPISIMTGIILLFILIPALWAKRVNLFLAALLFAYCIRTYIVFTSALFEGEVEKYSGIYLIVVLSFIILLASVFPKGRGSKV